MGERRTKRPFVLIVRDGWGSNPHLQWNHANAIHLANTPTDDRLMAKYPHVLIHTSGEAVGLPAGVMGNSEVGHQNIGAGRVVNQEILRIDKAITDESFFANEAATGAYDWARQSGGCVHIMGLCSDAGVHSSLGHLFACVELAKRIGFDPDKVFVHAFGDGRDTPPTSGIAFIRTIERTLRQIGVGRVASVVGRYYAMDRDNRWDRVEQAYRMLTRGDGRRAPCAEDAFQHYYDHPSDASRTGDEFVEPTVIAPDGTTPLAMIRDGDSVIFFNFRGDRPRELTKAFTFETFPYHAGGKDDAGALTGFERDRKLDLYFVTMSAYEKSLPVHVVFDRPAKMPDIFGAYISGLGLRQCRVAETEKFAHVTFFFNDYREEPFEGEDRQLLPSPRDVDTYDQKPQMAAQQVADEVVGRIESGKYDVMVVNFANGDMVGHTGDLKATLRGVEAVDVGVGRVVEAVRKAGGHLIVTADHGNCEQMIDPETNKPHTAHTTYDVEAILVDDDFKGHRLREDGSLADLIPTALEMMGLKQPTAMTGKSLLIDAPVPGHISAARNKALIGE